jgi:hypothetical protein
MPADWSGGLAPERDRVLSTKPENPDLREGVSFWLFEEQGAFAFPRIDIEGHAPTWENRAYNANVTLPGGRVLFDSGQAEALPPTGDTFGGGPLRFRCVEPFRRWQARFDGTMLDGTLAQQIAGELQAAPRVPVRFEAELEMAAPAWVQDISPERAARMSAAEKADAATLGFGCRIEQLFRASGTLAIDGAALDFRAQGTRIHRQGLRPLTSFRGHCWQSALFPGGRGFGYIAYPPAGDGSEPYNAGYVIDQGRLHPARAVRVPWLDGVVGEGDDVSLELQSELGTIRVAGATTLGTMRVIRPGGGPTTFRIHQGGARYRWDGEEAFGMIERTATEG